MREKKILRRSNTIVRDAALANRSGSEEGYALVAVLWVLAILALIAGQFANWARADLYVARNFADQQRLRQAADGGVELAMHAFQIGRMIDANGYDRFVFELDDVLISVEVVDEDQKLNLNTATTGEMASVLSRLSVEPEQAVLIANRIADWRDDDDIRRPYGAEEIDYRGEVGSQPYVPRNGPFLTVFELRGVIGVTPDLFEDVEPFLTVYSNPGEVTSSIRTSPLPDASGWRSALLPSMRDRPGRGSGEFAEGQNRMSDEENGVFENGRAVQTSHVRTFGVNSIAVGSDNVSRAKSTAVLRVIPQSRDVEILSWQ